MILRWLSRSRAVPLMLALTAFVTLSVIAAPHAGAILNGYKTSNSKFPWAVAVITKVGTHYSKCTGVLIQPSVVLTAGHCEVSSGTKVYSDLAETFLGLPADHSTGLSQAPITRYNPHDESNDIAILKLASSLPGTPLPPSSITPRPGAWLTAVGFGCDATVNACEANCGPTHTSTSPGYCFAEPGNYNGVGLRAVALQVVSSGCRGATSTRFCTYGGGASIMHGDSGGPVMLQNGRQWQLVGITNTDTYVDTTTGTKFHDGVTSIASELGWINSVLRPAPPPAPASPSPSPTPGPSPAPSPTPPTETGPTPAQPRTYFVYRVYGTCEDGACGLTVRAGPGYSEFASLGALPEGAEVDVVCQATGETVGPSPTTHNSSAIWDELVGGGWVSDLYITTPNVGTWSPPIPQC
jgi:hypothetical protein